MNRRRSLIIPPNNIVNRTPVITEVTGPVQEEFEIGDEVQQIPPPDIRSASSMLRSNLARLARATSQIQGREDQTNETHRGQSLRLRQLPTQHQLGTAQPHSTEPWHTTWHPPMQFPPIAIQFATKKNISQQNENK